MSPYADFKKAIAELVLKRKKDGAIIIASERTGTHALWMFDFRALMLQSKWLNRYAEIFWEHYQNRYPFQVGGMETASIPLVAAIVMKGMERGTPTNGFYVRKSRKRYDLVKAVEGTLTDDPIIFVDDLINSGQTLNKQVEILKRIGKRVTDLFVLLSFREKSAYAFADAHGVRFTSLFTLTDFDLPLLPPKAPEVPQESFIARWRYAAPNPSLHLVVEKSAPALDDARVFFGSDDGTFRALDQATGEVVWEFSVGPHPAGKGILSSPVVANGIVYFGAYDGNVYALNAKSGEVVWENSDADWVGSSPSIAPALGLLFIGLEFGLLRKQGGIMALSLTTGKRVWEHRTGALTHGSPLYIPEEGMVVIGSNDGFVYAYDAKTGSPRWQFETGGDIKSVCAYDPKRRLVLATSMDSKCYALRAKDGSPVFASQAGAGVYGAPLVANDIAYFASLDKRVYAIDLDSGKERWVYTTDGRIFATPALIGGSLWAGSNDGRLYELDPEKGTLRTFFQATERIVNSPAYNARTKRFFVPTVANEIYCLERKS